VSELVPPKEEEEGIIKKGSVSIHTRVPPWPRILAPVCHFFSVGSVVAMGKMVANSWRGGTKFLYTRVPDGATGETVHQATLLFARPS